MKKCKVDGCEKPAVGRGWCSMHHSRWLHHGALDFPTVPCDWCGALHQRTSFGQRGHGTGKYCSYVCRYKAQSRRRHERVVWPAERECIVCGERFTPRPQAMSTQRYCSGSCRVNYCRYREWASVVKPIVAIRKAIKEKR